MGVRSVLSVGRGAWCAAVVVLGVACGSGSEKPPSTANSGNDLGAKPDASGASTSTATSDVPAGPRRPSCDDGSCFVCGESICLSGFYCETAGSAAPACGWSAACAQKATCACLGPQLKGCTCEERGGVAHVRCGGS